MIFLLYIVIISLLVRIVEHPSYVMIMEGVNIDLFLHIKKFVIRFKRFDHSQPRDSP